jgi:hypothetical protein
MPKHLKKKQGTTHTLRMTFKSSLPTPSMIPQLKHPSPTQRNKRPKNNLPLLTRTLILQLLFLKLNKPSSSFYKNSNRSLKVRKLLLDKLKKKIASLNTSLLSTP